MNNLRRFCAVLILATALASVARAEGPINCPGIVQQPPQVQSSTVGTSSAPDAGTSVLLFFVETIGSLV
jgi:hypothetical protein